MPVAAVEHGPSSFSVSRVLLCRHTQLPKDMQQEFLEEQKGIFTPAAYSLFDNNCNNFSDTFAQFLTGNGIPVGCLLPYSCDRSN